MFWFLKFIIFPLRWEWYKEHLTYNKACAIPSVKKSGELEKGNAEELGREPSQSICLWQMKWHCWERYFVQSEAKIITIRSRILKYPVQVPAWEEYGRSREEIFDTMHIGHFTANPGRLEEALSSLLSLASGDNYHCSLGPFRADHVTKNNCYVLRTIEGAYNVVGS